MDNRSKKTRLSYVERSQKPTWFQALQAKLQKMSELVKPYLSDWDYPTAEHFFPTGPEFFEPRPAEYYDVTSLGGAPCIVTCFAPLYCDDDVECHPNVFRYPQGIGYFNAVEMLEWGVQYCPSGGPCAPHDDWEVDKFAVRPLKIHPPDGGWSVWPDNAMDIIKVTLKDLEESECDTTLKIFCRDATKCCDEAGYSFAFDDDNTADTIAPGGSITVHVTGGCGPYTFATSSTGYSFTAGTTGNPQDTLTSASGTCGTDYDAYCTFTVTDDCGTVVTGKIRSTGGQWSSQTNGCHATMQGVPDPSCPNQGAPWYYICEHIVDDVYQYQKISKTGGSACADCCLPYDNSPDCGSSGGTWCNDGGLAVALGSEQCISPVSICDDSLCDSACWWNGEIYYKTWEC